MKFLFRIILILSSFFSYGGTEDFIQRILQAQSALEFEIAENIIIEVGERSLQRELYTLNELLYFAGQKDSSYYNIPSPQTKIAPDVLAVIKELNRGYFELHYRKVKGDAFKYFHRALIYAREINHKSLQKAALLGILEYYHFEIAQNSRDQNEYLNSYKSLIDNDTDRLWAALYGMIFYTKSLEEETLEEATYDQLYDELNRLELILPQENRLRPRLYFEKALKFEIDENYGIAEEYYNKAIEASGSFPFNHMVRFFSFIHLSKIEQTREHFREALNYIKEARQHINQADTLRSNHFINKFASYYYQDLGIYDSAYASLNNAYMAEYYLDFRSNSREINRLNVVLETQQKELENFRLRQNSIWLIIGLGVVLVLLLISYLSYKNIRSKKRIVENEKEIEVQKVEKLLKEQELVGIDAMIEGQEKERRRIASDLHDNLGSLLAAIKHRFQSLEEMAMATDARRGSALNDTTELIEEAYQKVRTIAHARNAGVHADKGLLPAVKNFAAKVNVPDKLTITVRDHQMHERLDNSLEITLFRIIQELITNIVKHSAATEACVHLTHHENSINIMVEDNGKGMKKDAISADGGMGLYTIRKRVEGLHGAFTVESVKNKGTSIIIDIPLL